MHRVGSVPSLPSRGILAHCCANKHFQVVASIIVCVRACGAIDQNLRNLGTQYSRKANQWQLTHETLRALVPADHGVPPLYHECVVLWFQLSPARDDQIVGFSAHGHWCIDQMVMGLQNHAATGQLPSLQQLAPVSSWKSHECLSENCPLIHFTRYSLRH